MLWSESSTNARRAHATSNLLTSPPLDCKPIFQACIKHIAKHTTVDVAAPVMARLSVAVVWGGSNWTATLKIAGKKMSVILDAGVSFEKYLWGSGPTKMISSFDVASMLSQSYENRHGVAPDSGQLWNELLHTRPGDLLHDGVKDWPLELVQADEMPPLPRDGFTTIPRSFRSGKSVGMRTLFRQIFPSLTTPVGPDTVGLVRRLTPGHARRIAERHTMDSVGVANCTCNNSGIADFDNYDDTWFQGMLCGQPPANAFYRCSFGPLGWLQMAFVDAPWETTTQRCSKNSSISGSSRKSKAKKNGNLHWEVRGEVWKPKTEASVRNEFVPLAWKGHWSLPSTEVHLKSGFNCCLNADPRALTARGSTKTESSMSHRLSRTLRPGVGGVAGS